LAQNHEFSRLAKWCDRVGRPFRFSCVDLGLENSPALHLGPGQDAANSPAALGGAVGSPL